MEQLVTSGRYQHASEVLREGLRLVERREEEDALRLEALRNATQVGVADIEAERSSTFESPGLLSAHLKALSSQVISDS